jgi:hypothetical protein
MTQEQKELLRIDLCMRLPYGVKCVSGVDDATLIIEGINPNCCGASEVQVTYEKSGINFDTTISAIKPYLFPISSMTEEQFKEYMTIPSGHMTIDWFNKNHFDYRCLIERGLAIDATDKNIY